MSNESDPLDDLLGARKPRRNIDDALGDMSRAAETTRSAGDALDELIGGAAPRSRSADGAASESDRVETRNRWVIALALALALVGASGVITESIAASQLLGNSGPLSLALVWPLGGVGLLLIALFQSAYVDRFKRVPVVVAILASYVVFFAVTLILFQTDISARIPASIAWLLADQMNFLLPLVLWTLAGDVFTAGQGVVVFPRMSKWLFGGQAIGLAVSTVTPWIIDSDESLPWLLIIPPVALALIALLLPKALSGATTGAGHQRAESTGTAIKETVKLVRDLPAYRWIFWVGLAAIFGGTLVDFGFLHLSQDRYSSAGDIQVLYAGTSLACFVLCWLLQSFGSTRLINKYGVPRILQLLPIGALLGAAVLLIGGAAKVIALGSIALVIWRLPRWSIDGSARQAAMASLPDERRLRASFLIDLTPLALSLIVAAGPIALAAETDNLWIAPLIGMAFALLGLVLSRKTLTTWDDTQLSYRLKRRKRLG